jgi:hypothetical protein
MTTPSENLPRLLYVGDVPVESTVAGAALLFRLLVKYPKDRLRIMESNMMEWHPAARIPGVRYERFHVGFPRLLKTRWGGTYWRRLYRNAPKVGQRLARRLARDPWQPEAILTVAHTQGWITAAEIAQNLGIPLHVIIHDDVYSPFLPPDMREDCERHFAVVWRNAASRLCVSPFMAEKYQALYGPPGDVIYPSRAPDGLEYDQPPERIAQPNRSLNFVYAGSISSVSYGESISALADAVQSRKHRLTVFSQLTPEAAAKYKLVGPHVELRPIVPFTQLISFLREQADALYVPMSFAAEERANAEISFPSKLTDYTAAGLPLLVCGPSYGSAIRWVKENPSAAELVERAEDLVAAVQRLEDPAYRQRLATAAIAVGKEYFSHDRAIATFYRHLGKDRYQQDRSQRSA